MDIESIAGQIDSEIQAVDSPQKLEEFRLKYLGRKGILAELTAAIPSLPPQQRAEVGRKANALKNRINSLIQEKQGSLGGGRESAIAAACDITMPGIAEELGSLHPITATIKEICSIFERMGFAVVEGPEIETEHNNFTGLNIPLEHPSRDAFDTFYIKMPDGAGHGSRVKGQGQKGQLLLRSHTSPVQVRVMKARKPPLAVIVP
ncbi:MAG: phenylalanine--tRNA ligase subunit alpha, partial [Candidatus Omnitrophota bacterium]|nr:phenylalanine--tRNA ligase subunit alpha [Candidatus Omnitrophota bacterium]